MPRVKRGTKRRAKRKKILERASGYFLTKSKLYRSAKEAGVELDRKILADLAVKDPGAFKSLAEQAKTALSA